MKIIRINIRDKFLNKNTSFLFWSLCVVFFLFISLIKQYIFPSYFFSDAITIATYLDTAESFKFSDSYANTALIYSFFGITRGSIIFSILSSTFIFFIFLLSVRKNGAKISFVDLILFGFFCAIANVYMTILSKDFIVFVIVSIFILLDRFRRFSFFMWLVLCVFYGVFFRGYWLLFVIEFLCLYVLYKRTRSLFIFTFGVFISIFVLCASFELVLGFSADHYRLTVNELRISDDIQATQTMILPLISGNGIFISFLNISYIFLTFIFPIPLILLISPYYLFVSIMIITLMVRSFRIYFFEMKNKNSNSNRNRIGMYGSLFLSFMIIQALFEPDYGSFLRHLIPFIPLVFYILSANYRFREHNENIARC